LPVFGLSIGDALPDVPIQTVSTGTPQLMIPVNSLDALRRLNVNTLEFTRLHQRSDFFSVHLFCLTGITDQGRTFARHFAPPPDVFEDPFTGSATGGMAAYLWHYGLIDEPTFIAEQGHWLHRPGRAAVEVVGSRDTIETVKVGGGAVTVLRGELSL
jgi:trans-2,3-dihydro-3-hydroxyanthranilate isomerase